MTTAKKKTARPSGENIPEGQRHTVAVKLRLEPGEAADLKSLASDCRVSVSELVAYAVDILGRGSRLALRKAIAGADAKVRKGHLTWCETESSVTYEAEVRGHSLQVFKSSKEPAWEWSIYRMRDGRWCVVESGESTTEAEAKASARDAAGA